MDRSEFVSALSSVRPSSTFLALMGYTNEHGEVSDQSIVFHVSYKRLLERSLADLSLMHFESTLDLEAQDSLIASFRKSLEGMAETPVEEIDDAYERLFDSDGNHIRGIKHHRETDVFHIYGVLAAKKILKEVKYPEVKSKPLTLAKNAIKAQLPISKWRQFKLTPDKVRHISVDSLKLLPPV